MLKHPLALFKLHQHLSELYTSVYAQKTAHSWSQVSVYIIAKVTKGKQLGKIKMKTSRIVDAVFHRDILIQMASEDLPFLTILLFLIP